MHDISERLLLFNHKKKTTNTHECVWCVHMYDLLKYHRQHRSSPWFTSPIALWKDTHSQTHINTNTDRCTHIWESGVGICFYVAAAFFSLLYLRCKMIRARFKWCICCACLWLTFHRPATVAQPRNFMLYQQLMLNRRCLSTVSIFIFVSLMCGCLVFSFGFALLCWFFLVIWNFSRVFGLSTSFMQP